MKVPRALAFVFLITGLAFLHPSIGPVQLVRIDKGNPGLEEIFKAWDMDVVQELATCYLGRLDREDVLALRTAGVAVLVLDRDAADKTYLLVRPESERTTVDLRKRGRVVSLEPGTLLFWTRAGDPSAALPSGLPRKRLPASSIVPYLRAYPAAPAAARPAARDLRVGAIVDQVSRDNLKALIRALQDFQTRRTGTAGCDAAAAFIHDYFHMNGVGAEVQEYPTSGDAEAVVGELRGSAFPDDIVIICAHFDSTSTAPETLAPGADDNASGVAAVMEAARILARYPTDYTVRFLAFSGEEQGLYGSSAYALAAERADQRIVGVVNMDMIAYADAMPEDLEVFVNRASNWMGDRLFQDAAEYADLTVRTRVDPSMVYSDHASFWDHGYPALLAIEDEPLQNPTYHKTGDTLDTLNLDFCAQAAKAALATVAVLAQPAGFGPPPPLQLEARSSFFSSLLGTRKNIYISWEPQSNVAGYNIYRTDIPHNYYEKINDAPVTEVNYADRGVASGMWHYYVITAVGQDGAESNFSRQIEVPSVPPRQGAE
ncbi:M20/M25/M40 family metallo-hydrolase [bacterium]|nr:MAG: M20/M25/M40 family metallo-hydrolase [bacterium]